MPPPLCAKCRFGSALEGDSWCLSCTAWDSLSRELTGHWRSLAFQVRANHNYKQVIENVASIDRSACEEISSYLGLGRQPYYFNCVEARRPRLCWTTESVEHCLAGVSLSCQQWWTAVKAEAPYPEISWRGGEAGFVLPTAMKSIVRTRPPPHPAGWERCPQAARERYYENWCRMPPYQYKGEFLFSRGDRWRLATGGERELLLGYGFGHTELCWSASDQKRDPIGYEDERKSLVGDAFSIYSFVVVAASLCRRWLPSGLHYTHLANRMGLATGFRSPLRLTAPLARRLRYGFETIGAQRSVEDINPWLLGRVNHTGSDVRITTGAAPRAFN